MALSLVPGVGPGRLRALLARFGSGTAVLGASPDALAEVAGIGPKTAHAIRHFEDEEDEVRAQLHRAEQAAASLLTLHDDRFPALLKEIYDPPAFLWERGQVTPEDGRALAIVGTRRCSDYGRRVAEELASELVQRGFTIVSGLAYGVDAAAHRGALEAGGRTLAVLGSGVDRIYPQKHTRLARQVVESGALLSEYPMGADPEAANFPRRNRIISGLSLGTVVVESYDEGGALITARLAVEQNREVFAIPSTIYNSAGVGANRLIQRGHAKLVQGPDDIVEELNVAPLEGEEAKEAESPAPASLSDPEQVLLDALDHEPAHIDEICARVEMDSSTALVYLLELEFKGYVRQLAGKQFFRA